MTPAELIEQDCSLRAEADGLLARHGVLNILREHGEPHISGSYAMRLMTWRDLDIYLAMPDVTVRAFLDVGRQLVVALSPRKASYTDHLNFPATEGVRGFYLAIHTKPLDAGGWKIDVWGVSPELCEERMVYCERLAAEMTERSRQSALVIKNEVCRHPEYRNSVTSHDIYTAVLSGGCTSVEEFWRYHANHLATG